MSWKALFITWSKIVYHRGFISVQGHIIVLIGLTHQREEFKGFWWNFPPDTQVAESMCYPFLGPLSPFLAFLFWNMIIVVFEFSGIFVLYCMLWKDFSRFCQIPDLVMLNTLSSSVLPSFSPLVPLLSCACGRGCIEDVRGNLVEWQSRGDVRESHCWKKASTTLKKKRIGCAGLLHFFFPT